MPTSISELVTLKNLEKNPIVYFSAEYAIDDSLPIFAGGLGVLAADILLEAQEQNIPFIAIGLNYHRGFNTYLTESENSDSDPASCGFNLLKGKDGKDLLIEVEIEDRKVFVKTWIKDYGSAKLYLLDTHVESNVLLDRKITEFLYDPNMEIRAKQLMVLGFGGLSLIKAIGVEPSVYHLNEGQTSFVSLALAFDALKNKKLKGGLKEAVNYVRSKIVSTKHTILSGADLYLEKDLLSRILSSYLRDHKINIEELFSLDGVPEHPGTFSVTEFLLSSSVRVSGVSKFHCELEKLRNPSVKLIPITNGVNSARWLGTSWESSNYEKESDEGVWKSHIENKNRLLKRISSFCKVNLSPEVLTIVWARRFSGYKRPEALFYDVEHLARILSSPDRPAQVIMSGKASTADTEATKIVDKILGYTKEERFLGRICYIPDYTLNLAKDLVSGADVWLNTPIVGKEACGTSGMKAGLNGALQCSVLDGWLAEIDLDGMGWILPDLGIENKIYDLIENEIAPVFYKRNEKGLPVDWINKMREINKLIRTNFLTERLCFDYLSKLYFPD